MEVVSFDRWRGLAALGHDIHVITTAHNRANSSEKIAGVQFHFSPSGPPARYSDEFYNHALRIFADLSAEKRFDLVHMDSGAVPADRLKHLRPQGIPTVVTWHGNSFDIARNAFNLAIATDTSPYDHPGDWPKAREDALAQDIVTAYKATYSYRHQFDHHVAINDRASADLHSIYRVPRSNIHAIFNPIDGTKFSPSNRNKPATDFRSAHHIPADAILIGFVGRLIPEKGIRFFLDAAQRLLGDTTFSSAASPRKIIFVVAGHGDLNDLARKAAEAHPGKIMNLGRVPRTQIPALVAALDLLVDPSVHYHGLNTVLLEATCSATDILAADIESVASVWRPTVSGTMEPSSQSRSIGLFAMADIHALERAIRSRVADLQRSEGVAAAQARAKDNYRRYCPLFGMNTNVASYHRLFLHAVARVKDS